MAHIYTFLRQYLLSLSKNGIMIYFRRPAVLTLWKIIILPLDDPALPFRLRDIQVRHMESVMLLHPSLNLLIGRFALRRSHIHSSISTFTLM